MRIFFDTNVFVSAFIARGICTELYEAVALDHELIVGEPVYEELERILSDRLHVSPARRRRVRKELRRHEFASASARRISFPDDPADEAVLACALAAKADFLVTGDGAVLALQNVDGLKICSPRELWFKLVAP